MRTIDLISTQPQNVTWIYEGFKKGTLYVDNSFQREYVWLPKHQIKLIETILLGYSIPEIYLWITDTDPDTGVSKYSIVDGQQRIGAVYDFIQGKFKLSKDYIETETGASFSGKTFKELSPDEKRAIWDYPFSIRFIKRNVEREDIVAMFLRLNRTNMGLLPQELRNAEFEGLFIKLADEISENKFWTKNKIFSPQTVRRMKDIEFISQILIFLRKGVSGTTTQEAINEAYDHYNEVYDEYEEDKKMFERMLSALDNVIEKVSNNKKFIKKTTHLYSFLVLLYFLIEKVQEEKNFKDEKELDELIDQEVERFSGKSVLFIENYDNPSELKEQFDTEDMKDITMYKGLVTEGTQSKVKRIQRIKILKKLFNV